MSLRRHGWLLAALLAPLAGCATDPRITPDARWIDPSQAVQLASAAAPRGVSGVFAMTVQDADRPGPLYLNSERDYRDPRCLTVVVLPQAASALAARLHGEPERVLRGRRILVAGSARRVRIDFVVDGRRSGKYYYQTHVVVTDVAQIQPL
ncbi:hypothetical protein [Dyella sp.]|uniref:hypothetical protein n=1 Tax=Dyella sp. TaxID=1869338 RepID=UPI002D793B9A|nr:hypothetical protein [Dyella sp.]HET6432922.1 hypothetical protein [Dyella sp.]